MRNSCVDIVGKALTNNVKLKVQYGNNNMIRFGGGICHNCKVSFAGNDNQLIIGQGVDMYNVIFSFVGSGNIIIIGKDTYFDGNDEFCVGGGTKISVGENCMFAKNVSVRTTDSHRIINESGDIINNEKDVVLGRHVWIGMDSLLLKGTTIEEGCIVAARSLVTSSCMSEKNCLIAGSPAKKIKKKIQWT